MTSKASTTVYQMNEFQKRCKIKCKCPAQEIVYFYCTEKECEFNVSNPLYCNKCLILGTHKHTKPHVTIEEKLIELHMTWSIKKEDYSNLVDTSKKRYQALEPLILHFNSEL